MPLAIMSSSSRSRSAVSPRPERRSAIDRVHRAAAGVHLADRADELVALGDPVLQQVRQSAVALAEQRERVLLVVVGREHHDAGVGMLVADRVRAVDPLQLERGRHLDVGHHHVGRVLGGGGQQAGRVLGDPDDLDVVVGIEQRPHALAHEDVVLSQHDCDAHAARFPRESLARVRVYHPRMIRVVFAEDNYLVREGTAALLGTVDEVELVGTAEPRDELLAAVEEHGPDAVLTDIRMPPTGTNEGIEAAKQIRAGHPESASSFSQFADEDYAYDLLKDGAAGLGYLLKERVADVDELVRALEEVARGGSVLDPKVVEALGRREGPDGPLPAGVLTDREREVSAHMAQGQNNAAIAKSLFLTERAVEKHINSLFHKLDLTGGTRRASQGDGGACLPA